MRLKIFEELGQCFLEKQQYKIAEKVLRRALTLDHEDELELLGVYYHLGRACEAQGRGRRARRLRARARHGHQIPGRLGATGAALTEE
jgi:uncharacterized protein HemY